MDLLNLVFIAYFALHIPTTMLIDAQSVAPAHLFPTVLKDLLKWHIKVNKDHLVRDNPPWFMSLVMCEVLLQLPFFFVAVYAFTMQKKWIRVPALMYGVHVATTMAPILADILYGPLAGPHSPTLAAIYVPYLIIPVLIAWRMAASTDPFSRGGGKGGKRKVK